MNEQNKVVKFKKRKSINIGIIVFLILFIYVSINVYIYLTKEQLTIYEVHEGSNAVDNRMTGLILRDEKLVNSNKSGYVLYYQKDGSRVAKDEPIYSVSDNEIYNTSNNDGAIIVLNDQNDTEIKHQIHTFQNNYSDSDFSKVYDFKDSTESSVLDILNNSLVSNNQNSANKAGAMISNESGIITYYMDNFETIKPENVTADMFNKDKYKKVNLRTTDKISTNSPVYKMITSDQWNLVLPLTKDQYDKLRDNKIVTITVLEDDANINAQLQFTIRGKQIYAILTMDKDMANYLTERYLDVAINFNSEHGLKIPVSSLVEKDFYEVPYSYFTKGGESKDQGLIEEIDGENGKISYPFVPTEIYYTDKNKKYSYVDTKQFPVGTRIQSPKNSDQYILSKTKKLTGVYNVNLGYAVFKRVEILYKNKEYCIVKDNTENGLSAYDHIVLDGKMAVEQKIIY